jgi:hypothetical protein
LRRQRAAQTVQEVTESNKPVTGYDPLMDELIRAGMPDVEAHSLLRMVD